MALGHRDLESWPLPTWIGRVTERPGIYGGLLLLNNLTLCFLNISDLSRPIEIMFKCSLGGPSNVGPTFHVDFRAPRES